MTNSQKIVLQGFANQILTINSEIENLDVKLNKTNNAIASVEEELGNLQIKLSKLQVNKACILGEKEELKKTLDFVNDKCLEISGKNIEDLFEVIERKHAKGTKLVAVFKDSITGSVEKPNKEDSEDILNILPGTPDIVNSETPEDPTEETNYDPADDMPNF